MLRFKIKFFISYNHKDYERVKKLQSYILDFPFTEVFVAKDDIPLGVCPTDHICHQIKNSDYFIIFGTKHYHEANWTEQEVGVAWAYKINILPFQDEGVDIHGYPTHYQIKPIPTSHNEEFSSLLFSIIGYKCPNDLLDFMLDIELERSHTFDRSDAILSIAKSLTTRLTSTQSKFVIDAFMKNSQVWSRKWLVIMRSFRDRKDNSFLDLVDLPPKFPHDLSSWSAYGNTQEF